MQPVSNLGNRFFVLNIGITHRSRCSSHWGRFLLRDGSDHLACRLAFTPPRASIDPEALTDKSVPIAYLQRQLDLAIDEEDYSTAAQLRDEIQRRRFDNRLAIEEANDAFYAAFISGSQSAMAAVWGVGEHVQCIHPAAGCIAGRDTVLESWKLVLGGSRLKITLEDVRIYANETDGYVTCVEIVEADDSKGRIAATNIFEKQKGGKWKIIHHHASPLPSIVP